MNVFLVCFTALLEIYLLRKGGVLFGIHLQAIMEVIN